MRTNAWEMTKDGRALSPVIAVIIMVALTIVLAAVLYSMSIGYRRDGVQIPTVGAVYQPQDKNFTVHVEKIDPDPTSIRNVSYILLDDRSVGVPGVQGSLRDILNLDPDHEHTNITFYDNDNDENLSAGDVFWIKHADFGGEASEGYTLLLKFEITGNKINGGDVA